MARVRLRLRYIESGSSYYRPEDRSRTIQYVPHPRLFVSLMVLPPGADPGRRPDGLDNTWTPVAILDAGAPLTLFPFRVWQPFAIAVRWLAQPPTSQPHRVAILGGRFTYRLGRLRLGASDRDGRWLPAVWVNAWFLLEDSPAAPKQAVLGLRCRLLDRRQLRHQHDPTAPLGSTWWLEDT